jgi:recombination protein RecA
VEFGVIDKRGSYYYYTDDMRIAQGRENAKDFLRENPDLAEEIEEQIRTLVLDRSPFPSMDDDDVMDEGDADTDD